MRANFFSITAWAGRMSQCIAVTGMFHSTLYCINLPQHLSSFFMRMFALISELMLCPADGGCKHSLRGAHEKCSGVVGSYEGHIFKFQSGQVATLASFQQRCTLLASAGIQKHDPSYVLKTLCLPRSVVTALVAATSGPMPLHGPAQPIPAVKKRQQVGSWGFKRSFIDYEDWQDLLTLFPALKDRHHASHKILVEHWPKRKTFSPVTYTDGELEFVSDMAVCACHIHPDDVEHDNRIAGTVSLKPDARLRSVDSFKRIGSTDRALPTTRSPGNTPLAQHLREMYEDTLEKLLDLQRQAFETRVDDEVDSLRHQIEILKGEALTASNMLKAASEKASVSAKDAMVLGESLADSSLKAATVTAALSQALNSALDSEKKANEALAAANDALAAANENVDFISNSLRVDNVYVMV